MVSMQNTRFLCQVWRRNAVCMLVQQNRVGNVWEDGDPPSYRFFPSLPSSFEKVARMEKDLTIRVISTFMRLASWNIIDCRPLDNHPWFTRQGGKDLGERTSLSRNIYYVCAIWGRSNIG